MDAFSSGDEEAGSHRSPITAYATNCYPGESVDEMLSALRSEVSEVRRRLGGGDSVGLSLRLGIGQAEQLDADPGKLAALREALAEAGARVIGANAFPIAAPRGGVYKQDIYRPDWRDPQRLETTTRIARVIAALVDPGERAVISTLTGTCLLWPGAETAETEQACAANLRECAARLERISIETGRDLVMGLEPEPLTTGETLNGTLDYFRQRLFGGPDDELVRGRLGVNLDLCHAAVLFEDAAENMRAYRREGITVFGIHVSAALRTDCPVERLKELRAFCEPTYLHQVAAIDAEGRIFRCPDLEEMVGLPLGRLGELSEVRVHYHVPVYAEEIGGLATTSGLTWRAVRAARDENLADLFVVETYTWPQLRGVGGTAPSVAEGIARELRKTREVLARGGRRDT